MANFNHWKQIAQALPDNVHETVRAIAFNLAADARSNAPVQTGFLANSVYVETTTDTTYGAGGYHGAGDSYLLDPVDTPPDDYTAYVAVGANYGVYVEYGTRFMPAQPFFNPAVDNAESAMDDAMAKLGNGLAGEVAST